MTDRDRTKRDVLLDALCELVQSITETDKELVTVDRRRLRWLIEVIEGDDEQEASEKAFQEAVA